MILIPRPSFKRNFEVHMRRLIVNLNQHAAWWELGAEPIFIKHSEVNVVELRTGILKLVKYL